MHLYNSTHDAHIPCDVPGVCNRQRVHAPWSQGVGQGASTARNKGCRDARVFEQPRSRTKKHYVPFNPLYSRLFSIDETWVGGADRHIET
ncbi:hypothetical protein CJF39_13765 [Pseudomonas lundensis]|uniref:Uncharacterized protein n=1 Tax=Pseudomonas lundensis TaxID=86185 RepID=A0A266N923_9PSED|nr:hypothetical protein [Pseudomonas lundensis]OZY58939.1 hypothetical protein CJF39_13765 [Pseudomonas lundensis]